MKKYDLIRAVVEMQELKILSPAQSFQAIKEIVQKTLTGTNKNFDKTVGDYLDEAED